MGKYPSVICAIFLLFVASCSDPIIEPISLEGEWISEVNRRIAFSFVDDKCSYISPTGNFASYCLNNNIIIVSDTTQRNRKQKVKEYIFKIDKFSGGSMTLITDSTTLNSQFKYSDPTNFETFKLKRLNPLYNNSFSTLQFESTQCYGSCPSMKIIIDSLGNFNFEGRAYTEKNGYYTGKIKNKKLETLVRKLNCINLKSLKPNYSAMWTDDQTCILKIKSDDIEIETKVYGFNKEPIELRILINELMELYKSIDMKQDSLHEYYFDDFY